MEWKTDNLALFTKTSQNSGQISFFLRQKYTLRRIKFKGTAGRFSFFIIAFTKTKLTSKTALVCSQERFFQEGVKNLVTLSFSCIQLYVHLQKVAVFVYG